MVNIPIKQLITEGFFDWVDGKQTVYHGTSVDNKKNIQKNGLLKQHTGGENSATSILNAVDPTMHDNSLNKTYTTKSRWEAAKYAGTHLNGERITGLSDPIDQIKTIPNIIKSYITGDGIVKARIPKDFINKHEVLNPELKGYMDPKLNPTNVRFSPDFIREYIVPYRMKNTFGDNKVFKESIPTEFISGSKNYNTGISLDGIKENIKNKFNSNKSRYTKIRENLALRGSNKRVHRIDKNVKLIKAGATAAKIGGTAALVDHFYNQD